MHLYTGFLTVKVGLVLQKIPQKKKKEWIHMRVRALSLARWVVVVNLRQFDDFRIWDSLMAWTDQPPSYYIHQQTNE